MSKEDVMKITIEYLKTVSGCIKVENISERLTIFELANPSETPMGIWCELVGRIGDFPIMRTCSSVRGVDNVVRVSISWEV